MALHDQYTREIFEQLNYNATWLPTVQLMPGDVCSLRGNEIQRVAHLSEFDIPFVVEDGPVPTDFNYQVVSQVGNYGEIFDQNLTPLGLDRGYNDIWTNGGLLYAPPYR